MFDEGFQFQTNAIKPDIVTIDYEMKEVKIIEISTPFDAFIDNTYQSKFEKYFLLSANKANVKSQLALALAWNRCDIARTEIFTRENQSLWKVCHFNIE